MIIIKIVLILIIFFMAIIFLRMKYLKNENKGIEEVRARKLMRRMAENGEIENSFILPQESYKVRK